MRASQLHKFHMPLKTSVIYFIFVGVVKFYWC